ncbi:MAG: metallophosphoesterase [Cyanobacteriota bacterium]|nr:metallophosphoesterase [Cyanobacteriota bacterium]
MNLNFRFAIASDLHIALSHTIWDHPRRFHLVEASIPGLELVLEHLAKCDLDFLLLPGDLTQDGEVDNHVWLSGRLAKLPYPVYVVPGNHDVPVSVGNEKVTGLNDFPTHYHRFGYDNVDQLYYTHEILPGVRLIGLNSNLFDEAGKQKGHLDREQLTWLKDVLAMSQDQLVMVMLHHNVIEHLPGQATNPLGRRYMLENAPELLEILAQANVQLIFTGHLHVQDIAQWQNIYEITTGSLVSYPHPYRILNFQTDSNSNQVLRVESHYITSVAGLPDLPEQSRERIADHSLPFMTKLLTSPPLSLSQEEAVQFAPDLRYFWADVARGDAQLNFPHFPSQIRRYFESFSSHSTIDNNATLLLSSMR